MDTKILELGVDLINFDKDNVSIDSVDQLIKGHELKYIEKCLEAAEELSLASENVKDFVAYSPEVQAKAIENYDAATRDPDFFDREGADKELMKPIMILSNIENKKNEAKLKNWHVEYHARLIAKLKDFRNQF